MSTSSMSIVCTYHRKPDADKAASFVSTYADSVRCCRKALYSMFVIAASTYSVALLLIHVLVPNIDAVKA